MSPLRITISLVYLTFTSLSAMADWDGELWNTRCIDQLKKLNGEASMLSQEAKATDLTKKIITWQTAAEDTRLSFKITAIHPGKEADTILTHVIAGRYSSSEKEQKETHSNWEIIWKIKDETPLMHSLKELNTTTAKRVGSPLLLDKTAQLMAECPDAWQQLRTPAPHWLRSLSREISYTQNFYQGLAIADVNGDGLDDMLSCQPDGLPNRLLIQQADGTLRDESKSSGLHFLDRTRSALFVDFDNDGDVDLALGTRKALLILSNDGKGKFTLERTLMNHFPSIFSLSAADYDGDGRTDLHVCNYYLQESSNRFSLRPAPETFQDAANGGPNALFRNTSFEGTISFVDATEVTGLAKENHYFSLHASWQDFDNDGDPDLYVANDFGKNQLYRNDDGRFTNIIQETGAQDQNFSMNAAWGDWNRDGKPDLYVSNMFSSAGKRITYQQDFKKELSSEERASVQHLSRGNSLFTQKDDGTFTEEAYSRDVWLARWAWAGHFADIDHNAQPDILVTNGYITNTREDDL